MTNEKLPLKSKHVLGNSPRQLIWSNICFQGNSLLHFKLDKWGSDLKYGYCEYI